MTCGIYKIENKVNGKMYIGCSKNIEHRWKEHIMGRKDRTHLIHNAIKKYGLNNFVFDILLECPFMCFDYWEKMYITKYACIVPNGYNLTDGGRYSFIQSEITCEKKRVAMLGENNHFFGKTHTNETKEMMSANRKGKGGVQGRKTTDDVKEKLSKAHIGQVAWNKGMKGVYKTKPHSEETKRKMSEAKKIGWAKRKQEK